MDEPSPFDNKKRDWEDTFVKIITVVAVSSILVPFTLASLCVTITLIKDIIALF